MSFYNMSGYIQLDKEGLPVDTSNKHVKIKGRYIATSLYNRLLPRWHYYQLHQNVNPTVAEIPMIPIVETTSSNRTKKDTTTLLPLHLLAGASDQEFCKQMQLSPSDYLSFKKAKSPQLQFNSQFEIWLQTGRPITINKLVDS